MKISIITTVDHNVGDDFVREGIIFLLKKQFSEKNISFENIHKHSPITTRYGFEWFRNLRYSGRVDKIIPKFLTRDRIREADIVVQSGAPVYWCHKETHCCDNEWYKPLINQRFLRGENKKLLNLAAGSCQTYHSDGSEFCERCNEYIREFYKICAVTTVRDQLSKTILGKLNIDVPVIPCSSIFAVDNYGVKSNVEDYIALNYMQGGAHYTFGQKIDVDKWQQEFSKFYNNIKNKEKVVFVCHNRKEADEAKAFDPNASIFYKKDDYLAYIDFYSRAKFGILNRVHGAFMMASMGKPSVVIGNDSRAKMTSHIGLRNYFVNDANFELLMSEYEFLSKGADSFGERFKEIKDKAYKDYREALGKI